MKKHVQNCCVWALYVMGAANVWGMKPGQSEDWVVHTYTTKESSVRPQAVPYVAEEERIFTTGYLPQPARESSRAMSYDATPRALRARGPIRESIVNKVDGRKRVTPTISWPTTIHGQISIGIGDDLHAGGGSGTFVGPSHFLTAAHCVFGDDMEGWASSLTVHPALDDNVAPFGAYKVRQVYAYKAWTEETRDMAEFDLALLVLNRPVGYETGWASLLSLPTAELRQTRVSVTGYPGDKGCKQLWSMEDHLLHIDAETFSYKIDTYGGQSGGAVLAKNKIDVPSLVGVHTNGCADRNLGVRLSSKKFHDILAWMAETGGLGKAASSGQGASSSASSSTAAPGVGPGWGSGSSNPTDRSMTPIEDDVDGATPQVSGGSSVLRPSLADLPQYRQVEARQILQDLGLLAHPAQELLQASQKGDIARVNLLLAGCPDVSVEDTKTALMAALAAKDADMIKLFIKSAETRGHEYDTIVLKGSQFFAVRE